MVRAVIVPGNGCDSVRDANWYAWLESRLGEAKIFDEVSMADMPDPHRARRAIWLPFILSTLKADSKTVVIGHSSGAVAALRLLEEHKLHGALLVSACHTDLGEESEAQAGYYPPSGGPWQWEQIKVNSGGNIIMLHSDNDPFIPLAEPQHVSEQLGCELRVQPGRSHFFEPCESIVQAAHELAQRPPWET